MPRQTITLNPDLRSLNITSIDDVQMTEEDGNLKLAEFDTENSISFLLYTHNPIKKKPANILFWRLPNQFLGNKLSVYGGRLNYKIIFEHLKPDEQLSYSPDLVLVGSNQEEIHYSHPEPLKSKTLTKISISLIEDSFTDAKGEPIRKYQLMNVLFDLNRILIKASYTKNIIFTGIKEIQLENAGQIESCNCPVGYKNGGSCEQCDQGYFKKPGSYYHQCIPCDCNDNSKKCNSLTGKCLECDYNFIGDHCERCREGFLLSRTRGFTECLPLNTTINNDFREGRVCRDSVEGNNCERCKAGYYNLVDGECTKCSCSHVTDKCRENYGYLDEISIKSASIELKDKEFDRLFTVNASSDQKFTFVNLPRDRLAYWRLPAEFLGNKIKSYGYSLIYQLDITPVEVEGKILIMDPDVEIKSKSTTIVYMTGDTKLAADKQFSVPLREGKWEKLDTLNRQMSKLSKLEFLSILSDIQEISIRAVYHDRQQTASISNIKLITVVSQPTATSSQEKVLTNIEQCHCPIGYSSSSCESCANGFTKNSDGLCIKCTCNGHSNECIGNSQQQQCLNCNHNTEGLDCSRCKKGFYGDATLKTPNACKRCPCPTVREGGNFATSCRQQLENGEIICDCKEGCIF